jgi:hypothetical protein
VLEACPEKSKAGLEGTEAMRLESSDRMKAAVLEAILEEMETAEEWTL